MKSITSDVDTNKIHEIGMIKGKCIETYRYRKELENHLPEEGPDLEGLVHEETFFKRRRTQENQGICRFSL
jgi:hypothetical protein